MNKNSIWKRMLSSLLIAVMLVTMLPGMAFADEVTPYDGMEVILPLGSEQPADIEGFVWGEGKEETCNTIVHTHDNDCYVLNCDHKDGHSPA